MPATPVVIFLFSQVIVMLHENDFARGGCELDK